MFGKFYKFGSVFLVLGICLSVEIAQSPVAKSMLPSDAPEPLFPDAQSLIEEIRKDEELKQKVLCGLYDGGIELDDEGVLYGEGFPVEEGDLIEKSLKVLVECDKYDLLDYCALATVRRISWELGLFEIQKVKLDNSHTVNISVKKLQKDIPAIFLSASLGPPLRVDG
ncbi:MAG: hypothetical protein LBI26_00635 [Holosporales bacterium]|jgi:hypothetical protein|nr:hypothetical protein [Holosporales bacterium]